MADRFENSKRRIQEFGATTRLFDGRWGCHRRVCSRVWVGLGWFLVLESEMVSGCQALEVFGPGFVLAGRRPAAGLVHRIAVVVVPRETGILRGCSVFEEEQATGFEAAAGLAGFLGDASGPAIDAGVEMEGTARLVTCCFYLLPACDLHKTLVGNQYLASLNNLGAGRATSREIAWWPTR